MDREAWFVLGAVLLALELFVPGLFCLSFAIGAFAAGILALFQPGKTALEIVLFLTVSALANAAWLLSFLRKRGAVSGQDPAGLEGQTAGAISPGKPGTVVLDRPFAGARRWKARSWEAIPPATRVRVTRIQGITLDVETTGVPGS